MNKKSLLLGLSLASTLIFTGCGSSSSSEDTTIKTDGTAKSVVDPLDENQVYKYFGDTAQGNMSKPANYGALQYAVAGGHKMWPTFTVYLVKDDTITYKMQVLSNYGETGSLSSGNLYIRYAPIASTDNPSYAVLDATNAAEDAKLKLVDGTTVTDESWHIAYQKYVGFKSNGGTSGTGNVKICLAKTYDTLFDTDNKPVQAEFEKLSKDNTLANFNSINASSCTDDNFASDSIKTQIKTEDWLHADYSQGAPVYSAKDTDKNAWILRSATKTNDKYSYIRFKVKDVKVVFGASTSRKVTLAYESYDEENKKFNDIIDSVELDFSSSKVYWDLETNAIVTSADDWDLAISVVGRDYPIQINGGASGSGNAGIGTILDNN